MHNTPNRMFPSEAELMAMPIYRLRALDIFNGEQEHLVQKVLNKRILEVTPDNNTIYRNDVPDFTESELLKDPLLEQKWQRIIDKRNEKLRLTPPVDEEGDDASRGIEQEPEDQIDRTPDTEDVEIEVKSRFCQSCDSKGVRHKKYCPINGVTANTAQN